MRPELVVAGEGCAVAENMHDCDIVFLDRHAAHAGISLRYTVVVDCLELVVKRADVGFVEGGVERSVFELAVLAKRGCYCCPG